MQGIFLTVLTMSMVASVVILAVLLARMVLKRAPKVFSYVLWAVVLFRLLCPISPESPYSIIPDRVQQLPQSLAMAEELSPATAAQAAYRALGDTLNGGIDWVTIPLGQDEAGHPIATQAKHAQIWLAFFAYLWPLGMGALLLYSVASTIQLRRRLIGAVPLRENIFLADHIASPFVLGLIHPTIYLPSALPQEEQEYILLHEQYHIQRLDYLVRVLAFVALCIHWFNPLVWLAFVLSGQDMEMSCDEAVVQRIDRDIRADYSASLLSLATGRKIIVGTPLAFGEGNTRKRIENVMHYKKTAPLILLLAVAVVGIVSATLLTNPVDPYKDGIIFPAYTLENPDQIPYYDQLNATAPFKVELDLPAQWTLKLENGDEAVPMGEVFTPYYIYEGERLIGYIGFSSFEPYTEEIAPELYYQTVWPYLRLSSMYAWDPYTMVKTTDTGEAGTVEIQYMDPNEIDQHPGAMASVPRLNTMGILAYDKELEAFVGIAFMPDTVDPTLVEALAQSLTLTAVE